MSSSKYEDAELEELRETKADLTLRIIRDDGYSETPNDQGDHSLLLVSFHRDFYVKRDEIVTMELLQEYFRGSDQYIMPMDVTTAYGQMQYWIFGLEVYSHSGVVLALSQEGNFPDRRWDVSQCGAVLASTGEWPKEEEARKAARSLVTEWNDVMNGNVWGYVIEDANGEELESCWGCVGDPEYALPVGRESLNYLSTPDKVKERYEEKRAQDIALASKLVEPYGFMVAEKSL